MNIPFKDMPANARVWVYAANRPLSTDEQQAIQTAGEAFIETWTAHQQQLKASFALQHGHFIIIGVDEGYNEVSGCGIDKSVHFVQQLEKTYNLSLFNRLQLELWQHDQVLLTNKQNLAVMLQQGLVNKQSPVFNKTINTKADFDQHFLIPLEQSWVFSSLVASFIQ